MTNVSDILWYNSATGKSQIWFMEGNKVVKRSMVLGEDGSDLAIGLPWSIAGAGDFNQNGNADILWHNADTGHSQIWFMDGHRVVRRATVLAEDGGALTVGQPWRIAAVGHFNQDGKADIVWHNASTGHAQIWQIDGNRVIRRPTVLGEDGKALAVGAPWRIVGAGDFDQDGKADILWHNADTGHSQMWFMDGHKVVRRATVLGENGSALTVGLPWRVAGAGNFNQDGKADILWHNADTGRAQIWQMDGHRVVTRPMVIGEDGRILEVGQPWRIVGTGVFNLLAQASSKIRAFYLRTGGSLGPLGSPMGAPVQHTGTTRQDYQLGSITLNNAADSITAYTYYDAEVKLSAVKCFGTEDPGGTDETFLVISLISVNPNFNPTLGASAGGADKLVHTMRTEIDGHVTPGKVFFKQRTIGRLHAFPGSGIRVHVALFDHEHGNVDDLRDKINAALEEAANKGAQLIAGAIIGGDPRLAGAVGDVTEFEIGGIKPVKILTLGMADVLAGILSDDLVGEHEFFIPAEYIKQIAEQAPFLASFRRHPDVLGVDVQFNWPPTNEGEHLFSGGGGSYKVYLTVTPIKQERPLEPRIPMV